MTDAKRCQRTRGAHICRAPAVAKYRDRSARQVRWRHICDRCLAFVQAGRREPIEVVPLR